MMRWRSYLLDPKRCTLTLFFLDRYYLDGAKTPGTVASAEKPATPGPMEVDDGDAPSASRRALNAEELLEEAEREAGDVQLEAVDPRAVRRLAGALSKKVCASVGSRAGSWQ